MTVPTHPRKSRRNSLLLIVATASIPGWTDRKDPSALTFGRGDGCTINSNGDVRCWSSLANGRRQAHSPPPGADFTSIDSGYENSFGVSSPKSTIDMCP